MTTPGLGELPVHNDEGRARVFNTLTSQRINYYDDIIDYMVKTEVSRCQNEDKFTPSQQQIEFLKKELVRHAVIRRDVVTAQKIRINKSTILKS